MNFITHCAIFGIIALGFGQSALAHSDRCAEVEYKLRNLPLDHTVVSDSKIFSELKVAGIRPCASALTLTVCKSNQFRCNRRFISLDGPLGAWVFFTSGRGYYQLEFTVVPISGENPIKIPFTVENTDARPASDLPYLLPEPLIESHRISFNTPPSILDSQAIAQWIKSWAPSRIVPASSINGQPRSALQVLEAIRNGNLFRHVIFSDVEISRFIVGVLRHFSIPSRFALGIKKDLHRSAAWVEFKSPYFLDSQWVVFDPEAIDELRNQDDSKYQARSYYSKYQYDFTPIQRPVVEIME